MRVYFLLFLLLPLGSSAQQKGTYFEHGLSWQQVKEKAKKENKYLLVDCYTTWCAPCKQMATEVFPQEKVGDFLNKNFVNVKIQFDQTKNDSDEIKAWYPDASAINKEFKINAYPTFLIFSPQGELVHRIVGGGRADDFIAWTKVALNPETQYYTLMKKNDSAVTNPENLKKLALAAEIAKDEENSARFSDAFISTQKDLFTKANLEFLSQFSKKSSSKGFHLIMNNVGKVDSVLGTGKSNEILSKVIIQESISPALGEIDVDIDSLVTVTKAKYPSVDLSKPADMAKILSFLVNKKWERFQPAMLSYMKQYGKELSPDALKYFAGIVLENCKEPAYLHTYAELLYKFGAKEQATVMQQRATNLVPIETKSGN